MNTYFCWLASKLSFLLLSFFTVTIFFSQRALLYCLDIVTSSNRICFKTISQDQKSLSEQIWALDGDDEWSVHFGNLISSQTTRTLTRRTVNVINNAHTDTSLFLNHLTDMFREILITFCLITEAFSEMDFGEMEYGSIESARYSKKRSIGNFHNIFIQATVNWIWHLLQPLLCSLGSWLF